MELKFTLPDDVSIELSENGRSFILRSAGDKDFMGPDKTVAIISGMSRYDWVGVMSNEYTQELKFAKDLQRRDCL